VVKAVPDLGTDTLGMRKSGEDKTILGHSRLRRMDYLIHLGTNLVVIASRRDKLLGLGKCQGSRAIHPRDDGGSASRDFSNLVWLENACD